MIVVLCLNIACIRSLYTKLCDHTNLNSLSLLLLLLLLLALFLLILLILIFLTVIGSDTYTLLRNLLAPVSPSTKTVEELFETLKEHLKPQPIVIAERNKFCCRDQKENETISDYIALLRKLALNCNFREFLDETLRDRFVCGLINGSIRRRLLAEQTLTLKMTIDLAKTLESAEVETKLMNTEIKAENAFAIEQKSRRFYRCNSDGHLANTCPFKEYVFNTCKMKSYLSKACLTGAKRGFSRTWMVTSRNRSRPKNYNLEETDNIASDNENPVYYVHKIHHVNRLKVKMKVTIRTLTL